MEQMFPFGERRNVPFSGTFCLSPHENICTMGFININYLYTIHSKFKIVKDVPKVTVTYSIIMHELDRLSKISCVILNVVHVNAFSVLKAFTWTTFKITHDILDRRSNSCIIIE